jgi:hypothetical protein
MSAPPTAQLGLFDAETEEKNESEPAGKQAKTGESVKVGEEAKEKKISSGGIVTSLSNKPLMDLNSREKRTNRLTFERWRQKRAIEELEQFLDHHPIGTADQYREARQFMSGNEQRLSSTASHTASLMQRGETGALSTLKEKKRELREKWKLAEWVDLRA